MVAAFAAIRKRLCIISGGPGTGKTRTVVLLLALLLEQADNAKLRIALAAPTGKAAARLQEAVKNAKAALPCGQEIKDRLPEEASTIHRLLRSVPDSAYFRHDADNPLPVDVVVIDEASMVDLALMAKLVAAIHRCSQVGDALIDVYQRIEDYLNRVPRDYARARKLIRLSARGVAINERRKFPIGRPI